jgi:hypothetical protein
VCKRPQASRSEPEASEGKSRESIVVPPDALDAAARGLRAATRIGVVDIDPALFDAHYAHALNGYGLEFLES